MSSHCEVSLHIIFGLYQHKKYLNEEIRSYIAGIINALNGKTIIVGGTSDHVHILCYLPKDSSIASFVRRIKNNSSKWYNQRGFGRMQWQTGYAAFSVSKTNISTVKEYINNQEEHHKSLSFEEEMYKYLDNPIAREAWKKWVFKNED